MLDRYGQSQVVQELALWSLALMGPSLTGHIPNCLELDISTPVKPTLTPTVVVDPVHLISFRFNRSARSKIQMENHSGPEEARLVLLNTLDFPIVGRLPQASNHFASPYRNKADRPNC